MKKVNIKSTYRAPVLQQVFLLRLEEDLLGASVVDSLGEVESVGQQRVVKDFSDSESGYNDNWLD